MVNKERKKIQVLNDQSIECLFIVVEYQINELFDGLLAELNRMCT
jgi:hypothetical protein